MIILGDCLKKMKDIPDGSIDMILTDPPFGTTMCKWDSVIPFKPLWEQLLRVCKHNAAILMFCSQPFTTDMINSQRKLFRYQWIWEKNQACGVLNSKRMPMKIFEEINVFYRKLPTYNPQMRKGKMRKRYTMYSISPLYGKYSKKEPQDIGLSDLYYPTNILKFKNIQGTKKLHPTQKPVDLLSYLIKTYTNKNEKVLDFAMGSGSTGCACLETDRKFIGIEKDKKYFEIAKDRLENYQPAIDIFKE